MNFEVILVQKLDVIVTSITFINNTTLVERLSRILLEPGH